MQDLIKRVEAATGPCRELDREVMFALGYRFEERHIGGYFDDGEIALDWVFVDPITDKWVSTHPHDFTSSIDAAMTLVPKGWIVGILRYFNNDGEFVSRVRLTDSFSVGRGGEPWEEITVEAVRAEIKTDADPTALALCAAALRARSANG